jgi:hypothetical protein
VASVQCRGFFLSYQALTEEKPLANPTVAQKVPLSFTPKDANGVVVDLVANPTALTGVAYSVDAPAVATVNVTGPTTAELVPATPGTVSVTLKAVNVLGEALSQTLDPITFDDVAPPVPAVKSLNLVAGDPVAK